MSPYITNGDDLVQILLNTLSGVGFPFPSGFMAAGHTVLKFAQCLQLLGQMLPDAAHLPPEQSAASRNDDGALLPEDLFLRVVNANPCEKRTLEIAKSFQGNV